MLCLSTLYLAGRQFAPTLKDVFEILGITKEPDLTYCTTDPRHPRTRRKSGLYPLHLVRAENALGRLLLKGENVVHIDGNHFNNRSNNLAVKDIVGTWSLDEMKQRAA